METATQTGVIKQHLIDPEICIRCNTCEATCPIDAITHDDANYVVRADVCNGCMACVPPCPTGAIDNWRMIPITRAYSIDEQFGWDSLPEPLPEEELAGADVDTADIADFAPAQPTAASTAADAAVPLVGSFNAQVPPWSGAHAYTNLYGANQPITARVVGNMRVNEPGTSNETHHIVLDFGSMPFPVLEGQSIGIVPPGVDAQGRAHHARQYSVASARNGERAGYNNLSLTVKRVVEDPQGNPVQGVCSNYLCNLELGSPVQVIGPFGGTFLMPNHPGSHIVMICTGTGSAPMRAMTEWRRRLRKRGRAPGGKLLLFFGARTREELPYFGPLMNLPKDFIDVNLAFSRTPGAPKRYVQDAMRDRAPDLTELLGDSNSHFYVCGLKSMEEGVLLALRDMAGQAGMDWQQLGTRLKAEGRLHMETY